MTKVNGITFLISRNLSIIFTAILSQLFFNRRLCSIQWVAVILLFLGATTSQLHNCQKESNFQFSLIGYFLCIFLALISSSVGIYTEYIYKKPNHIPFLIQNLQMYIFGILVNIIALYIFDKNQFLSNNWFQGFSTITYAIILNHALSGIATAIALKFSNNITKVFTSAFAMVISSFVSLAIFGDFIGIQIYLGIGIVVCALFLFFGPGTEIELKNMNLGNNNNQNNNNENNYQNNNNENNKSK
eukprot:TRINITY_DN540_c3_g1_i1.p1 TRINITY_DN540_c3_g1~~TRINITY_DN540_c3_g1_i1.p1  ORF type:complete len:244 (+),score=63.04 TRINITY_DN540_c3_g1_i1:290-1021(+)